MNLLPLPRSVQVRTGIFLLTGRTPVIASPDPLPLTGLPGQPTAHTGRQDQV